MSETWDEMESCMETKCVPVRAVSDGESMVITGMDEELAKVTVAMEAEWMMASVEGNVEVDSEQIVCD